MDPAVYFSPAAFFILYGVGLMFFPLVEAPTTSNRSSLFLMDSSRDRTSCEVGPKHFFSRSSYFFQDFVLGFVHSFPPTRMAVPSRTFAPLQIAQKVFFSRFLPFYGE